MNNGMQYFLNVHTPFKNKEKEVAKFFQDYAKKHPEKTPEEIAQDFSMYTPRVKGFLK